MGSLWGFCETTNVYDNNGDVKFFCMGNNIKSFSSQCLKNSNTMFKNRFNFKSKHKTWKLKTKTQNVHDVISKGYE
jgi:hypothetical protein